MVVVFILLWFSVTDGLTQGLGSEVFFFFSVFEHWLRIRVRSFEKTENSEISFTFKSDFNFINILYYIY